MTRKLFLFFVMLAASLSAVFSQPDIVNATLPNMSDAFIYTGVSNIFTITGFTNIGSIQLRSANLQIEKTNEPATFIVNANTTGKDTIYLISAGKVILKKQFEIIDPQQMKAVLGWLTDSVVTVKQVIINSILRAIIPNCNCHLANVSGFQIMFVSKHLESWEKQVDVAGNKFGGIEARINRLQPNDKIIFDNIRAVGIICPRKLNSFTITIK